MITEEEVEPRDNTTDAAVTVSTREIATVLHALRFLQDEGGDEEELGGCVHFEEHKPLSGDEIDGLCESLEAVDHTTTGPRH